VETVRVVPHQVAQDGSFGLVSGGESLLVNQLGFAEGMFLIFSIKLVSGNKLKLLVNKRKKLIVSFLIPVTYGNQ
jgi:hypothetical protein